MNVIEIAFPIFVFSFFIVLEDLFKERFSIKSVWLIYGYVFGVVYLYETGFEIIISWIIFVFAFSFTAKRFLKLKEGDYLLINILALFCLKFGLFLQFFGLFLLIFVSNQIFMKIVKAEKMPFSIFIILAFILALRC